MQVDGVVYGLAGKWCSNEYTEDSHGIENIERWKIEVAVNEQIGEKSSNI